MFKSQISDHIGTGKNLATISANGSNSDFGKVLMKQRSGSLGEKRLSNAQVNDLLLLVMSAPPCLAVPLLWLVATGISIDLVGFVVSVFQGSMASTQDQCGYKLLCALVK